MLQVFKTSMFQVGFFLKGFQKIECIQVFVSWWKELIRFQMLVTIFKVSGINAIYF